MSKTRDGVLPRSKIDVRMPKGAAIPRADVSEHSLPPTWYFPTQDPEVVIACDYNPAAQRYDLNTRRIRIADLPEQIRIAIER